MRRLTWIACFVTCACSGSTTASLGQPDGGGDDASIVPPSLFGDAGPREGGCVNLQCDIPSCPTTVSGTVFDPAGRVPLYDVAVYIPNAPLDPIPTGVDLTKCDACAAPLSGNPLSVALTDSHGHFTLTNVPVTSAPVQLVVQ